MVNGMFKQWLSAFGLALLSSGAYAQAPDGVIINRVGHGGNGCPQGSVDTYVSADRQALTLTFDQYIAEIGDGIPRSEARKFCNVSLELVVPNGWQFSVFQVDYRGYVDLESGAQSNLSSTYRFSGRTGNQEERTFNRAVFRGSVSGNYLKKDDIGIETLVWSPCAETRALNINSEVRLTAPRNRRALMTVDTIDGEFKQIYALKWRRCGR